jgi:hypothetical protein
MNLALRNSALKFFYDASVLKLTLIGIIAYILTAFILAFVYFAIDGVEPVDKSHTLNLFDYLYFSFNTQTTAGYGTLLPVNMGKVVVVLHSMIGIAAPAILLGLLVTKLLLPSQSGLRVSRPVIFYPDNKYFKFRFFNNQSIPLEEVEFTVRFRNPVEPGSIIQDQHDIYLERTSAPILAYRNVWILNTLPSDPLKAKKPKSHGGAQVKTVLSPRHINKDSTIILQVKGTFYQSKHISTVIFDFKRVKCGEFEIIQKKPGDIANKNIDLYKRVTAEVCHECAFREHCQLQDRWS